MQITVYKPRIQQTRNMIIELIPERQNVPEKLDSHTQNAAILLE